MPDSGDVFIRQQVYLEAVKNEQAEQFDEVGEAIVATMVALLLKTGYQTFAEMPKRALRALLGDANRRLTKIFIHFQGITQRQLRDIVAADAKVTRAVMNEVRPSSVPIVPARDVPTPTKIYNKAAAEIVPGTGLTMREMLGGYFAGIKKDILDLIKRGFASNMSIKELLAMLNGTAANAFKDGLLRKLRNQFGALTDTLIQYLSSYIGVLIGSLMTDRYQWISVLDSNTTDYCWNQAYRVYRYGQGPIPPAHYRCRSRIRPYWGTEPNPAPTFWQWLVGQPAAVQNDAVGRKEGAAVRRGQRTAEDFKRYRSNGRLTPAGYLAKLTRMLT